MIIPKNIIYLTIFAFILAIFIPVFNSLEFIFYCYVSVVFLASVVDFVGAGNSAKNIEVKFAKVYYLRQLSKGKILVDFINNNQQNSAKIDKIMFVLPDFFSELEYQRKLQIIPVNSTHLEVNCKPNSRGVVNNFCCYFTSSSPLNLWSVRHKIINTESEIKIFPDTFSEQKKMAGLFLSRNIGAISSQVAGKSLDFDHLRDYQVGDSIDLIDWKATAKKNYPVSRIYNNESNQTIYAIIDTSRLSLQKKNNKSNLDYYLASALNLANLAARNKDSFGLIIFDSNIKKFVIAKPGIGNVKLCRNESFDIQASDSLPDYNKLFSFIRNKIHQRSLLFFMTDLTNSLAAEEFEQDIHLINKKHLCMTIALKNDKLKPLLKETIANDDEIFDALSNHVQWQQLNILSHRLSKNGVGSCFSSRKNLSVDLVNSYLNVKRRQLL